MKCIYCGYKETDVTNSRKTANFTMVWRRRRCMKCKSIFTTREGTFFDNLFVIKRNKKRARFVYEKLFVSIVTVLSFKKDRDNGALALEAKKLSYDVLEKIRISQRKVVTSAELAKEVYDLLKKKHPQSAELYKYYSAFRSANIR